MISEFDFEFDPDMGMSSSQVVPHFLIEKDMKVLARDDSNHSFAGRKIGFERYYEKKVDKESTEKE
jgi:hypothetical protein